jgi:hypothetical protein
MEWVWILSQGISSGSSQAQILGLLTVMDSILSWFEGLPEPDFASDAGDLLVS